MSSSLPIAVGAASSDNWAEGTLRSSVSASFFTSVEVGNLIFRYVSAAQLLKLSVLNRGQKSMRPELSSSMHSPLNTGQELKSRASNEGHRDPGPSAQKLRQPRNI